MQVRVRKRLVWQQLIPRTVDIVRQRRVRVQVAEENNIPFMLRPIGKTRLGGNPNAREK